MSFEFLISSDNEIFKAIVTNNGKIVVVNSSAEEVDIEAELAAMELGFEPSAGYDAINIWNSFIQYLDAIGDLESLIDDIASSGETKKEWVQPDRFSFSDEPGYYREYTSTFTISDLLGHIGPAMQQWLQDGDDLSVEMAKFLRSIRRKNGKPLSFSISNTGEWNIETKPERTKVWSGIDRVLVADGVVLAKWMEDFEREIYDPVSLVSEVDLDRDQMDIAGSRELQEVIVALGLTKEERRLDEESAKDAPGPDTPERDDEGDYGVLYDRYVYIKDTVTGQWSDVRKIDVVPYWSLKDAEWALSLSEEIVDDRDDDRDGWFRMEIVRRLNALHVVRELQEKEELTEEEADFLERQLTLFEQYELDASHVSPFPRDIDVWIPIGDEEDDDE